MHSWALVGKFKLQWEQSNQMTKGKIEENFKKKLQFFRLDKNAGFLFLA